MRMQVSGQLGGTVAAPISKSHLHRLMTAAALCAGGEETSIRPVTVSQDIQATARCLRAAGARLLLGEDQIQVTPLPLGHNPQALAETDCGESGSTLRFLLPVFAALGLPSRFVGSGKLPQRPMLPLTSQLRQHGVAVEGDSLPITLEGQLRGGEFSFPGNISSQYLTGLLLALPLLPGDSLLRLTSPLESRAYVDMTLEVLQEFGVRVDAAQDCFRIPGGQRYRSPGPVVAQGDWSNAAFWLCAGALGTAPVTVTGLSPRSSQGDRQVCGILERMGASLSWEGNRVTCRGGRLHAAVIDGSQIPDLIPVLSVVAALSQGETRIVNAGRLRIKESDRLHAMAVCLRALGAQVEELPEGLTILGRPQLEGGAVDSHNDHRIAMSMAVAATRCRGPVVLGDPLCVAKSYPHFYNDFQLLGGNAHVL